MGKGGCLPTITSKKIQSSISKKNIPITHSELSQKTSIQECWIAYESKVYDVTHWLAKHPGGVRSIMSAAGQDATSVMKSLHHPSTLATMMKRTRQVGVLIDSHDNSNTDSKEKDNEKEPLSKEMRARKRSQEIHAEFQKLNQELQSEGWYDAKPLAYIPDIIRVAMFAFVGVSLVLLSTESMVWNQISLVIGSLLLGLFLQNIAFMGHDAGHGSITGNFTFDLYFGFLVGNAFAGIDVSWWKSTHYVHHSATNSLHDDPDIQHMPLLCFDERFYENRWSTYHGKYMTLDTLGTMLLPYQHYYYYPVMAVARVNLYIQSMIYLAQTCPLLNKKRAGTEIVDEHGQVKETYAWPAPSLKIWTMSVLSIMFYWYVCVYSLLSKLSTQDAIICFFVSHMMAGLLHVQILLSHVAMHYCADGHGSTDAITAPNGNDSAGYYEWQALSTMDVDCPTWMDWFHGGLQFQLEHHLFPRVPRRHLRALCKRTDAIFAKYNVPVVRIPFVEANRKVLRHMAIVGAKAAKVKSM